MGATYQRDQRERERDDIRHRLLARIDEILVRLFPEGVRRGTRFHIGNVHGDKGDSLSVRLGGEQAGTWKDFATGEGGDIFDLIAARHGLSSHKDFGQVLDIARDLLGMPKPAGKLQGLASTSSGWGVPTAHWDYLDADGKPIARVYRYDPPGGRKQFRPWDARRRQWAAPEVRPLYNQPGIKDADRVVLVEGEKCAQALIDAGIPATTAMNGAMAPVEKTDWSPLAGKHVLIWPDNDDPGKSYAQKAAKAALAAGAASCAILHIPEDKPPKWDAADAVQDGMDVRAFVEHAQRISVTMDDLNPQDTQTRRTEGEHRKKDKTDIAHHDENMASVPGSEDAIALIFADRHQDDVRHVADWGQWLVWDGARWKVDNTYATIHKIREICREHALQAFGEEKGGKIAAKLTTASAVSGIERLARSDPRLASTTEQWDNNPWLLNTPAGTVDLTTGVMRNHRRDDLMTKVTTASPAHERPSSSAWGRFLAEITNGDEALQKYLQRVVGYALTGSTREHALFFLYGTGANGKSVFLSTLVSILGDYAKYAPMDAFMDSHFDRHPTDLAGLRGARLVAATETEEGRYWSEAKLKNLTGGERISARFMRQDYFEFTPQFKLFIAGNHKPMIRNLDEAMRRRIHLIPFTVTIPPERRDPELANKLLREEKDLIMTWALEGCLEWQKVGLNPPQNVIHATQEYFETQDVLGAWIDEQCLIIPDAWSSVNELFLDWMRWAERKGEDPGSQRRFSDELAARGFSRWRKPSGRGFKGVRLRIRTSYDEDNDT